MYQSVLHKPRNLDEDIYDLTNPKNEKTYDKAFHKKIKDEYKTVDKFLSSDIWSQFKSAYHEKYSK